MESEGDGKEKDPFSDQLAGSGLAPTRRTGGTRISSFGSCTQVVPKTNHQSPLQYMVMNSTIRRSESYKINHFTFFSHSYVIKVFDEEYCKRYLAGR